MPHSIRLLKKSKRHARRGSKLTEVSVDDIYGIRDICIDGPVFH